MTSLLLDHLAAFVPLEILELQKQGGPDEWHFEEARRRWQALDFQAHEAVQYAMPKFTSTTIANLVECLAVMAFCPGGVRFGPLHFEGKREHNENTI